MSRLAEIAARRAVLRSEMAASRSRARAAAQGLGRDAAVALAVSALGRWLTKRFRWGAVAAAVVGLVAAQVMRRSAPAPAPTPRAR
ncbi:MAG: hypothetical protein KGL68_02100 [Burkholderiales bacterium]|nr:hypothetical protein [Burkholderiales bacterium]